MTDGPKPQLEQSTLGSLPVIRGDGAPRLSAGLVFRVGTVDETLPVRGITHLVEHLTLSQLGSQNYDFNAQVGPTTTTFYASGTAEEICAYFAHVCAALRQLPMDRIHDHIRVLRLEAAGSSLNFVEQFLRVRYGHTPWGALGFDEMALLRTDIPDLQGWADRWFNAANAVLWVSGEPPAELVIDLRAGERHPVPAPRPRAVPVPSWVAAQWGNLCGVSMVGQRGIEFSVLMSILQRRAINQLRHVEAVAYQVMPSYLPMGAELAHATLAASALPETAQSLSAWFDWVLTNAADGGIQESELTDLLAQFDRADHAMDLAHSLPSNAERLLLGMELWDPNRQREELEALSAGAMTDLVRKLALSRMVVTLPGAGPVPGLAPMKLGEARALPGKRFTPLRIANKLRLRVGESGMTLIRTSSGPRETFTVKWDETALLAEWPNGQMEIYGEDATMIRIDPYVWGDTRRIRKLVKQGIAPGTAVMVNLPQQVRAGWQRSNTLALLAVALLGLIWVGSGAAALIHPDPAHPTDPLSIVFGAVPLAYVGYRYRRVGSLLENPLDWLGIRRGRGSPPA
jgi:hypothetical protein